MKYLVTDPKIASGHLVIKGTRIRIAHILRLIVEGVSIEQIQKDWYPWLSLTSLRGAVKEAIKQVENPALTSSNA